MDRKIERRAGRRFGLLASVALVVAALYGAYLLLADLSVSRLTVDPDRLLITTVDRGPFQEQVTVRAELQPPPGAASESPPGRGAQTSYAGGGGALTLRADIHPSYLPRIEVGSPAELERGGRASPLRVTAIDAAAGEGRAALELGFVEAPPEDLEAGESASVHIPLGSPTVVTRLRRGAFFQHTGGRWVYRVDDEGGAAVKQPLRLGRQSAGFYEVLTGLEPGDRVIISSYEQFGDVDRLVLRSKAAGAGRRPQGGTS